MDPREMSEIQRNMIALMWLCIALIGITIATTLAFMLSGVDGLLWFTVGLWTQRTVQYFRTLARTAQPKLADDKNE